MKAIHARQLHAKAKREMAAFDALPQDIRNWLRTANMNWECTKLKTRLTKASTKQSGRWGTERLLEQYRFEDSGVSAA